MLVLRHERALQLSEGGVSYEKRAFELKGRGLYQATGRLCVVGACLKGRASHNQSSVFP